MKLQTPFLNMTLDLWFYLGNPFDNVTKNSFTLMNLMATDHHDKLYGKAQTDQQIADIYNNFVSAYDNFKNLFVETVELSGKYQAQTQIVEEKLAELSAKKIRRWDIAIQQFFEDDSPEYKSLLPDFRVPFQNGAYEERIKEVKALWRKLSQFSQLANVEADVKQFAIELETLRTRQQGFEQAERELSQNLELARIELSAQMMIVLCRLKIMYIYDLKKVETFYDLQYLRRPTPETEEEKLKKAADKEKKEADKEKKEGEKDKKKEEKNTTPPNPPAEK